MASILPAETPVDSDILVSATPLTSENAVFADFAAVISAATPDESFPVTPAPVLPDAPADSPATAFSSDFHSVNLSSTNNLQLGFSSQINSPPGDNGNYYISDVDQIPIKSLSPIPDLSVGKKGKSNSLVRESDVEDSEQQQQQQHQSLLIDGAVSNVICSDDIASVEIRNAETSYAIEKNGLNPQYNSPFEVTDINTDKGGMEVSGSKDEIEDKNLHFDCSSATDLSWSSIVRVTDEMTHEQVVDSLASESFPAGSRSSSSAVDEPFGGSKLASPVFTNAFEVDDFLDPADTDDADVSGGSSSRSSQSPSQQDVVVEEVRESDSSSFEYVMANSSNKDDSPTLSDFSQMDVGVRAMSENGVEELGVTAMSEDGGDELDAGSCAAVEEGSRSVSEDKDEDLGVGPTEFSNSSFSPFDSAAPLITDIKDREESVGPNEIKSPRDEFDSSDSTPKKNASIGAAASADITSIDGEIEGYLSMDEPFARDELISPDRNGFDSSSMHVVAPMLDNDVVKHEFSIFGMEYQGLELSNVSSTEKSYLAGEASSKDVHPFIFAATDCTPVISDDEDVPSRDAPPAFNVDVEQFEDLGENRGNVGTDYIIRDDDVDDMDDPSLTINAPFGNSFSERSSLSASFRGSLPRQLSSSALANQLFARSRDGSLGEADSTKGLPAYEVDGVVADLREDKAKLEETIENLKDELAQSRSKAEFLKAENQSLTSRLFEMEDSIRTVELEAKTRERNDEKTLQETVSKLEKQNLEMLNQFTEENVELSAENEELKGDFGRVRKELDASKLELMRVEEKFLETHSSSEDWRKAFEATKADADVERRKFDAERERTADVIEEMTRELEDFKTFYSDAQPLVKMRTTSYADLPNKVADLEAELKAMRVENAEFKESRDELEVQLMNLEREPRGGGGGSSGGGSSSFSETTESLEAEMDRASKEQLVKLVQSEKEVNKQLKDYVDKVILVILENRPELLEIMANMEVKTRG